MSEIEIEAQIEEQIGENVENLNDRFDTFMDEMIPQDVTPLEDALKVAESALTVAMKGSAIEYIAATKARDEAKRSLHNATALTQDESTARSIEAHKFMVALHQVVSQFDEKHGISYSPVKGTKTRKSNASGVSALEWAGIPQDAKVKYAMKYDASTGTMVVNGHTCRTISTWKRHAGI